MTKFIFISFLAFTFLFGNENASAQTLSRVDVRIVTDEAEAVLQILAKREDGREITEEDWRRLFQSEGYVRLQKRERAIKRAFDDDDFKTFVLSDDLVGRRRALTETLARWKESDVDEIALRPLSYLPPNAYIRAKIYPVIKPRDNSFVFDVTGDPAIFLYLDPNKSREAFENEFAHELHHIGYGTSCPARERADEIERLSPATRKMMKWLGAFGEGFAMLAAAGGADVHPNEFALPADKEQWDNDVANFNDDRQKLETFFGELADGKLSEKEENEKASSFYGVQGAWYTVGWQMAVVIEKTLGRAKLIEAMCDRRKLLPIYNKAVGKYNRRNKMRLSKWSKEFTATSNVEFWNKKSRKR